MNIEEIKTMTRYQILLELAGHAKPQWYHSLLEMPTWGLKILLEYYKKDPSKAHQIITTINHGTCDAVVFMRPFPIAFKPA